MSELVIFAAVVLTAVVIAWFLTGRGPGDVEGPESPANERSRHRAERSTFGPAGPGAEAMGPGRSSPSRSDRPRPWT